MQLKRRTKSLSVLIPCYKRPEYTVRCIKAIEDAQSYEDVTFVLVDDSSRDDTIKILRDCKLPKHTILHRLNSGLRHTVIDFFEWVQKYQKNSLTRFDMIGKIDNDVLMPKNWLNDMIKVFENSPVEILSPNYEPSNPAYKFGKADPNCRGFRSTQNIGGVWLMYADLIKDIHFERHNLWGIKGTCNIMKQIFMEKDPIAGWATEVIGQDLGHWSGIHPEHIKTPKHMAYYQEVGRNIAWN